MSTGDVPMYRDGYGKLWVMIESGDYVAVDESKDRQMIGGVMWVRDAPSFEAGLFSNIQWISVEEDRPDRSVDVIVSVSGVFGIAYLSSFFAGNWVYVYLSKPTNGPVTHWAHIPLAFSVGRRHN